MYYLYVGQNTPRQSPPPPFALKKVKEVRNEKCPTKSYPYSQRTDSKRAPSHPPRLEVFTIYSLGQLERTIRAGGFIYGQLNDIKNKKGSKGENKMS